MKIVFRADASIQIGTGHIMRCLTLAHALKNKGAECQFICRAHMGNLIEYVKGKGFQVHVLPHNSDLFAEIKSRQSSSQLAHAEWLGVSQAQDAEECAGILEAIQPDWLIVDHYAIDVTWENRLIGYYGKLMVIDDLADRFHIADVLLDQNLGRKKEDYLALIPLNCNLLIGPKYALLRPEFSMLRNYSLQRRHDGVLRKILINMGGVDKDNVTGIVLASLEKFEFSPDIQITIVMGPTAPWIDDVKEKSKLLSCRTEVLVNVSDMAKIMSENDLAIGAAGSTSWERCCLGLPTLMMVLADNQQAVAKYLDVNGAAIAINLNSDLPKELIKTISWLSSRKLEMKRISKAASLITNGQGVNFLYSIL